MITDLGRRVRTGLQLAAEPNVIPFIDVLLVLLIIFMVTAPKATVDLRLDLANTRGPAASIPPTIIDISESGAVSVAGREVPFESLVNVVMNQAMGADAVLTADDVFAEARIYVRADQDVEYGAVVSVIDELEQGGFEKVGVFAQTEEEA